MHKNGATSQQRVIRTQPLVGSTGRLRLPWLRSQEGLGEWAQQSLPVHSTWLSGSKLWRLPCIFLHGHLASNDARLGGFLSFGLVSREAIEGKPRPDLCQAVPRNLTLFLFAPFGSISSTPRQA